MPTEQRLCKTWSINDYVELENVLIVQLCTTTKVNLNMSVFFN